MSVLRRLVESRDATPVADAVRARRDPVSLDVSPDVALQHAAVYACVRLIADGVAGLPAHAYRPSPDGDARLRVDPQPTILTAPHRDLTPFEWRRQVVVSMLMRGNGFVLLTEVDRKGVPLKGTPLDPGKVTCAASGDRWVWRVNGDEVRLFSDGGELVHFPAFQLPGSPLGFSPLQIAAQAVGVGLQAERFAGRWFVDGAAPSSVLETDQSLDDEQARRLQAKWMAAHGAGSRFPAVLSGGVSWRPVTISPEESQFLETQRFSVAQIARLFGVPPHMIGDTERSTSWGSGIEQQHIGYLTHTLSPVIQVIDGRMTTLLPRGQYVRSNTASLLRADSMTRFQSYVQARMAGWLSVNEIRALEELPPVDDGDGYIQPLNMGPLGSDPLNPSEVPNADS